MILLFTDFGTNGPYVGQMKSVLYDAAPDSVVIDLMHDAPKFDPKASAYLLSALSKFVPKDTIILAVVDPGVGHPARRPIMIQTDCHWFVGPDNGLFHRVVKDSRDVSCYEIVTDSNISSSFHGRDVFAPAASQLVKQRLPRTHRITNSSLLKTNWPEELAEVIYIDHYGNAMTGLRAANIEKTAKLVISDVVVSYARTFSSVKKGELFWYKNSIGLVEISQNLESVHKGLDINIGMPVAFHDKD